MQIKNTLKTTNRTPTIGPYMKALFNSVASLSDNLSVDVSAGSLLDALFSTVGKVPGLTVEGDVTSGVCTAEAAAVGAVLEKHQED